MGGSSASKKSSSAKPAKSVKAAAPRKTTTKKSTTAAAPKPASTKARSAAKPKATAKSSKDTILEIADTAVVRQVSDKVVGSIRKSEHWHTLLFALVVIFAAYFSYQASSQMGHRQVDTPAPTASVSQTPTPEPVVEQPTFNFPVDYAWLTQNIGSDLTLAPGESGELVLSVKNTGKATWYRDGENPFRLGTLQPENEAMPFMGASVIGENQLREAINHNRIEMEQKAVAPGEVANFRLNVKAVNWENQPLAKGRYVITVGFLVEGKGTLSKNPLTWIVNVR